MRRSRCAAALRTTLTPLSASLQHTRTPHPPHPPPQYVATVHSAFVEGEGGLVYDAAGRAYHPPHQFFTRTGALPPLPTHTPAQVRRLRAGGGRALLLGVCVH